MSSRKPRYPGEHDTEELVAAIRHDFPGLVLFGRGDRDEVRLHQHAQPVQERQFGTPMLMDVADALRDLMTRYRCVFGLGSGFAANQVRTLPLLSIAGVRRADGSQFVMCNPRLSEPEGLGVFPEGCASAPELAGVVEEPWAQTLAYCTPEGEPVAVRVAGRDARVPAHETRHLAGHLCIDPEVAVGTFSVPGGRAEILQLGPLQQLA